MDDVCRRKEKLLFKIDNKYYCILIYVGVLQLFGEKALYISTHLGIMIFITSRR